MPPDFSNPDYNSLPKRVRDFLEDIPKPRCCIACRAEFALDQKSFRCSRCTVAHYCSTECQSKHYGFHKVQCKRIGRNIAELKRINDNQNDPAIVTSRLYLVDALVATGYRESDTVKNATLYYKKALNYCIELYKLMGAQFFRFPSLEAKALELMVVLGADSDLLEEWCMNSGTARIVNYMPASPSAAAHAPPELDTHGLAASDYTHQSLSLLAAMRSLAQCRKDVEAYDTFRKEQYIAKQIPSDVIQSHVRPFLIGPKGNGPLELLPRQINLLIRAIRHHGNYESLEHLRDTQPWQSQHAPEFLRNFMERSNPPQEYWYLYQDCFFQTPGLYDVLTEFVPEE